MLSLQQCIKVITFLRVPTTLRLQQLLIQESTSQVCLSRFQGGALICNLSSLMSLGKVIDFQLVQLLIIYKLLTCQS